MFDIVAGGGKSFKEQSYVMGTDWIQKASDHGRHLKSSGSTINTRTVPP
jgi:hypothetical protein